VRLIFFETNAPASFFPRMHCKDGRALELTVSVTLAPGFLSGYTKIVRFLPRYIFINTLPYAVRLWQDSSIFRPPASDNTMNAIEGERKWRSNTGKRSLRKVNQYETLFARQTVLDERKVGTIPGGTRAHPSALYVTSIGQSEVVPFNLPDSRGERQLRVGLGGLWNLTASVSADVQGEHTLNVTRAVDLKMTPHVSTRSWPEYEVTMKPSDVIHFTNELGVWFETEWGNVRKLIVKAVKKGSFAFHETDVHVGDELLLIDGDPVSQLTFSDAMGRLRSRLSALAEASKTAPVNPSRHKRRASLSFVGLGPRSSIDSTSQEVPPLKLKFRTVEERLRRLRLKAAKASDLQDIMHGPSQSDEQDLASTTDQDSYVRPNYLKAELREVQNSLFFILREEKSAPYQIQNRTIDSTVYYRQKGCDGHPWQFLKPGQSSGYAWEEPLRPKRLTVRVAAGQAFTLGGRDSENAYGGAMDLAAPLLLFGDKNARSGKKNVFRGKYKDEEDSVFSPSISVRLEEIGFRDYLPCYISKDSEIELAANRYLELEVDVIGATRVLVIQDASTSDGLVELSQHLKSLAARREEEESRHSKLVELKTQLGESCDDNIALDRIVHGAQELMTDFPEENTITSCHQIVVEVLEANGLSPDTFVGSCNPYALVSVRDTRSRRIPLFSKADVRRTYYVSKTVSPTWKSQSFVFSVPSEAVTATRGYSVKVKLRNFRQFGHHANLGAAQVELHSVRDQKPLVGWFPLVGRTGRQELENPFSYWGRGSLKMRLQWIYTIPALLDYFLLLSEKHSLDLKESLDGMSQQLANKKEAEARKREEVDGFQKVRIHDLMHLSGNVQKLRLTHSVAPRLIDGLTSAGASLGMPQLMEEEPEASSSDIVSLPKTFLRTAATWSPASKYARAGSAHDAALSKIGSGKMFHHRNHNIQNLEHLINQKRQKFSTSLRSHDLMDTRRTSVVVQKDYSGTLSVSSFKSWGAAQVLVRDPDLKVVVEGDELKLSLSPHALFARAPERLKDVDTKHAVAKKLSLPNCAPSAMLAAAQAGALAYQTSRNSFERAANRKVRSALHPGGWLVVRPYTALNLSDAHTGMFVRLRYGPDVQSTETVDARICPTWHNPRLSKVHHDSPNDLHIHVAPQKTSGSIVLSVVGEKSHANLHSKTELGVLHLPLRATIAACTDSTEIYKGGYRDDPLALSKTYVRWFPLRQPSDASPVEGDLGYSVRPPEEEKESDNSFHEYFAPCIQLAIFWLPDSEELSLSKPATERSKRRKSRKKDIQRGTSSKTASPTVARYFIADIGRVSGALIDSQKALELLSLNVSDIELRYWTTKAKTRMGISIGWLQIDQQDDDAREPVIFAPTPTGYIGPVIQILAVRDNARSMAEVVSFDFIDMSFAEYDLTLEESTLLDLVEFMTSVKLRKGFMVRTSQQSAEVERAVVIQDSDSLLAAGAKDDHQGLLSLLLGDEENVTGSEKRVYIEQLVLYVWQHQVLMKWSHIF